jgi:hypothetical protein
MVTHRPTGARFTFQRCLVKETAGSQEKPKMAKGALYFHEGMERKKRWVDVGWKDRCF